MTKTQAITSAQLRELRSEMERDLAWLLRSLISKQTRRRGSANGDSSTRSASEQDEIESVLRQRVQTRLATIVAALARLDNGEYGECVSCRRPISYGRLAVMPEATHCIACSAQGGTMRPHDAALGGSQPGATP